MDASEMSPEQRIVIAAVETIEAFGIDGATTRRIATRAGVNVASINYYFRTKENLIAQALQHSLRNAFDWDDFSPSDDYTAADRLVYIIDDLVRGVRTFPRLTHAHFSRETEPDGTPGISLRELAGFLRQVEEDLERRGVSQSRARLRESVLQVVMATVIGAVFFPSLFELYGGFSIDDRDARRKYVRNVVDSALSHREDRSEEAD